MGVFKWLRRERVTVTTRHNVSSSPTISEDATGIDQTDNIRTEKYKRDLAEFQARRSAGSKELQTTPIKKTCGRHSLPVSCTKCSTDHDNTFNYEKKSAIKYRKKQERRAKSSSPEKDCEGVPNIQFLFQNQVFMPGNLFPAKSFTEPQRSKQKSQQQHHCKRPDLDFIVQKQIDFSDDEQAKSPPEFFKNNSLPYDVMDFLDSSRINEEEVDGPQAAGDVRSSSVTSRNANKNDSCDDKLWEVMCELKHFDQWADEQLQPRSANTTKSDDSKSEASTYGLPMASARYIEVNMDKSRLWNNGKWGLMPVQIKKLTGVTAEHVRKKLNTEINILRKYRHPNIILLMGLYPDALNNVNIICERCVDSLFGIIHIQGRIMSVQTSVQYALDIANALVFLRMQGYMHTELNSTSIMVTSHDSAKLVDVGPCTKLPLKKDNTKQYEIYPKEPQYVNIEGTREPSTLDCEPLISQNSSEAYLTYNAILKPYHTYKNSDLYQWQAPELYMPNEDSMVYVCSKSDVYSLCLVLWECCNASIPWKNLCYDKLQEQYTLRKVGISLPQDGTYPGCLLSLLQTGLKLERNERIDLYALQKNLQTMKTSLDELGYIIIPARLPFKKITFNSTTWDTTDSDCLSPQNVQRKPAIHKNSRNAADSSTESSEKDCSKSDTTSIYESLKKSYVESQYSVPERCSPSNVANVENRSVINYDKLPEKEYSSACSTPIAKLKARIRELDTPGTLHRSDSTEYCSILSPNRTLNFGSNDDSNKDQNSIERSTAKLSRSFTPKSYKPLHIKVPDYNLDSIRPLIKRQNSAEHSTYNFDIKNYSLPTTPIARSNKLRKNAWLSGELTASEKCSEKNKDVSPKSSDKDISMKNIQSASETPAVSVYSTTDDPVTSESNSPKRDKTDDQDNKTVDFSRDSYTGLRIINHPQDFLSSEHTDTKTRTNTWTKTDSDRVGTKHGVEDDILANVNVRPLVAIHEKWIYEANKKTGRSMSLPENNRCQIPAVKPASHCVDTLQKSLPQLNVRKPAKVFRSSLPASPTSSCLKNVGQWKQFCQARDSVVKNFQFSSRDSESYHAYRRDSDDKSSEPKSDIKIDQSTDTHNIEEYIRSLVRKEFQHMIQELPDDCSSVSTLQKNDELLNKGVANIIESLHALDDEKCPKRDAVKSFSRVKINGNNKPLLQITFSRSGENSLQVLDNCVNVTLCEGNASGRDKLNVSLEETANEDIHVNSLKRCQAFNAIQEARSTEDLYIDDDLSAQLQENFGGKVKLIPLHGSLHEILCEKEDDCCLIKVKQENGCDTIYFRCDNNSDTESRDAIDGTQTENRQDTVVFKRSISLIEERIQRVIPKEKRQPTPVLPRKKPNEARVRPKSEILVPITKETRVLSNSSPSLPSKDDREFEVNIENAMCYQDSSSDECLRCSDNDDFELLERKIEEDIANNSSSLTCGCLEKISEENLSSLNDELSDRN